ncbi:hypothetical protein [Rummeliibacillus pycnus]|uniref:hypothetical protein n=1 Tax=Rummeliibacillus pycnus TaxID=101070 RepID=UPI0037C8CCA3
MKVSVSKINTFQNTAQFKQSSLTQESYLQIEKRLKNKSPRIITERKNGYVRKYLLKADGTKVLIFETRINEQPLLPDSEKPSQIPTTSTNTTQEMLDFLNVSSQFRSIHLKKYKL